MRFLSSLQKTQRRFVVRLMPSNHSSATFHYMTGRFPGRLGWLIGPRARTKTRLRPWVDYALDNDAFTAWTAGTEWSEAEWFELLDWVKKTRTTPLWALVPDVVADRQATLNKWEQYAPEIESRGWNAAFAVQDGMTPNDIPRNADVIFIGGTTEWKWRSLPMWTEHFPRVHVGRVNEPRRLWTCEDHGVESVDGSGWFRDTEEGRRIWHIQQWLENKDPRKQQLELC